MNCHSALFFFLQIFFQSLLLLSFLQGSEFIFTHSVLFITLSNLHHLLSLSLGLLYLFPCLFLLHFKQSYTVCKEFCIILCLLLVYASFFEGASDLIWFLIIFIIFTTVLRVVLLLIWSVLLVVAVLPFKFLMYLLLIMWNGLHFFR